MKAAVLLEAKKPLEVREVALDNPGPHELLIRVAASGLCHSDLHFAKGDLPIALPVVLGHEAAGVVEAVGSDVRGFAVGDHVVSCALIFCGHCDPCVSGRGHMCIDKPRRTEADGPRLTMDGKPVTQLAQLGGFAEQMLVHQNSIVRVDRSMPLDRAALLGCGVLTGVGAVFNAAKVSPGSRVVVIGCGGVGLNVIQGARIAGAEQIVAIDVNPEKRTLAEHFGATDFIVSGPDVVKEVREVTHGGADFAFEVIGIPDAITQGVQMMAPSGLMTIIGAPKAGAMIQIPGMPTLNNEWRIQGSHFGAGAFTRDIPRFVSMYLKGQIDLDTLISGRIGLDGVNEGFARMMGGAQARNVITFDDVLASAAAHA